MKMNTDKSARTPELSIVRQNLLTRVGYSPYCGADSCYAGQPRTDFNGKQFRCVCGWESKFEPEFIERYKEARKALAGVSRG